MKFLSRTQATEEAQTPGTIIGVGTSFRGTVMVSGTLRVDGEFDGDVLSCERLEIGEHGIMRSDIEVKSALILGRMVGNLRALGMIEMKSGAHVEGDVTALSVVMEPGVFFTGRCTMLENGPEGVDLGTEHLRPRELVRD